MGHMTRDAQTKHLNGGMSVTEFGIANNRKYTTASGEKREDVLFVDCAAFGKTGETIAQYLGKGKPIFIEGRLKLDQWEDTNGGGKRSKISVIVNSFTFIGAPGGGDEDQTAPARPASRPPAARPRQSAPPEEQPFGDEGQFEESEIPF